MPLDEIQVDEQLRFIEEPVEIMNREVKDRRHCHIPIVRVRRNSKRGPDFAPRSQDIPGVRLFPVGTCLVLFTFYFAAENIFMFTQRKTLSIKLT